MRIVYAMLLLGLLTACAQQHKVDLIVHHAKIYTVDSAFTIAEAMAVNNGEIVATGTNQDIQARYTATESVDAAGKAIYPGFIDAHSHFLGYGQSLFAVNLYGCKSWAEAVERVKAFAAEHPDEPIIKGRGWDQNLWPGKQFPDNTLLNQLFPDKPVLLGRVDGHATIANAKTLQLAGITPGQTVEGGSIEMKNGQLTGILIDNAVKLTAGVTPAATIADYEKWLLAAQKNCFAQGLTTVSDCGLLHDDAAIMDGLQKEDKLLMRLYVLLSDNTANLERYLKSGPYKTSRMLIKGFKVYADGALGSRGACLIHSYSDQPGWNGFLLNTYQHFDSVANVLAATDFQMCTHAIGDSANRTILNIYSKYLQKGNDKRWRIEHAQTIAPFDFVLFGNHSIIPSVQPTHATSDMLWAVDRLGKERLATAYAYKQLLQQNGWLPLGTDFPVEDISPFRTFYAAVVRKDDQGRPASGFQTDNALTREQALRGMTIWAAKGCFLEKEIGSLEKGKKADFIMLDQDLLTTAESSLLKTKVVATYMDGRKVFPAQ